MQAYLLVNSKRVIQGLNIHSTTQVVVKLIICILLRKQNIFPPLLVKNKPRGGETEHVFILGLLDLYGCER